MQKAFTGGDDMAHLGERPALLSIFASANDRDDVCEFPGRSARFQHAGGWACELPSFRLLPPLLKAGIYTENQVSVRAHHLAKALSTEPCKLRFYRRGVLQFHSR